MGVFNVRRCNCSNAYSPQEPQWSSFDKSILLFICMLHFSILHLPTGVGNSFVIIFFTIFVMNFILHNKHILSLCGYSTTFRKRWAKKRSVGNMQNKNL